jgi:hypothetical protein
MQRELFETLSVNWPGMQRFSSALRGGPIGLTAGNPGRHFERYRLTGIETTALQARNRDPAERPHRPVDMLFRSLAEHGRANVIGIILSGSGSDGAKGFLAFWEDCCGRASDAKIKLRKLTATIKLS